MKVWENRQAQQAARIGGLGLMAVSLAACGGSSETDDTDEGEDDDDDVVVPPVNKAVALTIGQDIVEDGTDTGAGDDTITGAMLQGNGGVTAQSFEDADEIDGGDGDDTLTVTIDDDVAAMVSNVEAFIVRNVGAGAEIVDMANFDDSLETITVRDSSVGTVINNIQSAASISLDNVTSTVTIDFDDDVLDSDEAIGLLTVDGTTSTITVTVGGDDVLTGAIIDVVSDSAITLAGASDLETVETVVITGAGDLSLIDGTAEFAAITEVDASDLAGDLTMDLSSATAAVTFTGGSGDDDVTSSGFDDEISTGAGDDSVAVDAAGDVTVDAGAGDDTVRITVLGLDDGDTIDGGAGDNIIEVDADTLDELETALFTDENVTNFTTVAIFAAGVAQTFDANDVVTTISVDVDLTAGDTLTINNFSGGTLEINAAQADAITVLSVGTTDSVTVAIGHTTVAGVTIDDVQLDGIETVTIEANASGATTVTTLDLTGTETLVISGDSNLDLDAANVVDTTLETVDLSDMTGVLELDLDTDGVTIIVGDLGDGSTITLAAGDRNTIEFGAEISNEIEISGFDAGSTLSDDVMDLSALGIDFADLDIADDGTDTTITSDAFDGSIVLLGVADWTTLAEAQFVM
jgi:S-layer protein